MSTRTIGIILMVVGVVISLVSLFGDAVGISQTPRLFGTIQIIGIIAGEVILVAGVVLYMRVRGTST